jgi:hypothetical protein
MSSMSARLRRIGASCTFGAVALIATIVLTIVLHINSDCNGTSVKNFWLQQAWTVENARAVVDGWHECERAAVEQVLLDYLFILAYVALLVFIGLRSRRAAELRDMSALACAARVPVWGGLIAGVFDCLENVGLLVMIGWRDLPPIVPLLTSLCSLFKWLLILISFGIGIVTGIVVLIHWWTWRDAKAPSR